MLVECRKVRWDWGRASVGKTLFCWIGLCNNATALPALVHAGWFWIYLSVVQVGAGLKPAPTNFNCVARGTP